MNPRHLDVLLSNHFDRYKETLVLLGARQVGKTTILQKIYPKAQYLTVDNDPVKLALEKYDPNSYRQILNSDNETIIIDEIHRLSDPGRAVKIIYDQLPEYKLIITGSSAFNIKNKTSESLAGRKIEYRLFPLTLNEYLVQTGIESELTFKLFENNLVLGNSQDELKSYNKQAIMNSLLIYGSYPAMISHPNDSIFLENLVDSVVFKDLTELQLLENKSAALSLLKLLSYQIGSLVNYSELALRLGIDVRTIKRYIELFEQSFIIFTLKPFTTRKRDEIFKMPKVYFYDLGLRNALIGNFNPIDSRGDAGQIFENFIINEAFKYNSYGNFGYKLNFWRTKNDSEVDLVLSKESTNELIAIEIKLNNGRVNTSFKNRYPNSKNILVTKNNYWV